MSALRLALLSARSICSCDCARAIGPGHSQCVDERYMCSRLTPVVFRPDHLSLPHCLRLASTVIEVVLGKARGHSTSDASFVCHSSTLHFPRRSFLDKRRVWHSSTALIGVAPSSCGGVFDLTRLDVDLVIDRWQWWWWL